MYAKQIRNVLMTLLFRLLEKFFSAMIGVASKKSWLNCLCLQTMPLLV